MVRCMTIISTIPYSDRNERIVPFSLHNTHTNVSCTHKYYFPDIISLEVSDIADGSSKMPH